MAWEALKDRDFDVAPVAERVIHRFVQRGALAGTDRSVLDHALPITADHLVSSDLGLAAGLRLLAEQRFYFVLKGDRISSIVTLADLQRPPVSMVALAFILSAESDLDILIRRTLGNGEWRASLPASRLARASNILDAQRSYNTTIDLLQCLTLHDRARIVSKTPALLNILAYSQGDWDNWTRRVKHLRNVLAHGGNVLDDAPDPEDAIRHFNATRDFAGRVHRCMLQVGASEL
jgi:hypothetical protein